MILKGTTIDMLFDLAWRSLPAKLRKNVLHVVKYHQVLPVTDPLCDSTLSVEAFHEQVRWLVKNMAVLKASEAFDLLERGRLPSRATILTFDDGYASNFECVTPILQQNAISGLFFLSSGHLGHHALWDDRVKFILRETTETTLDLSFLDLDRYRLDRIEDQQRAYCAICPCLKYLPADLRQERLNTLETITGVDSCNRPVMLTPTQIQDMVRLGMEIGSHTVNHPILTQQTSAEARWNIEVDKRNLESIIGEEVQFFSYPNGIPNKDYDLSHTRMVRDAGFRAAVSTSHSVARTGMDMMQLPRFNLWPHHAQGYSSRIITSYLSRPEFATVR